LEKNIRKLSIDIERISGKVGLPARASLPKAPKIEPKTRKRLIRSGLIAGNFILLIGVALFVWTNRSASQTIRSGTLNSFASSSSAQVGPLDQLSSAQIALTAARLAGLPEATAVRNQADSDSILLKVTPNDTQSVTKPELVTAGQKSRADITQYVVQPGENIQAIANKLGVNADNIRWSNSVNGNTVAAGTKLDIPPVNGIVYSVKAGDTPASLAGRFHTDESQIISFNDAEITGLKPGDKIIIPDGRIQAVAPSIQPSAIFFTANYGGNGYDFGYCTWYAATRVAVPTNWGNANTWSIYAAASGWTVSSSPRAGAIAQTRGMSYLGHVGYVEQVSPDGSQILLSDMNGVAPGSRWGHAGTGWVPTSLFEHYIYR
jgi:surface antigen